jgi:hypothetical protein
MAFHRQLVPQTEPQPFGTHGVGGGGVPDCWCHCCTAPPTPPELLWPRYSSPGSGLSFCVWIILALVRLSGGGRPAVQRAWAPGGSHGAMAVPEYALATTPTGTDG